MRYLKSDNDKFVKQVREVALVVIVVGTGNATTTSTTTDHHRRTSFFCLQSSSRFLLYEFQYYKAKVAATRESKDSFSFLPSFLFVLSNEFTDDVVSKLQITTGNRPPPYMYMPCQHGTSQQTSSPK